MPDTYKLQYDGMTLTYPGFNGFLNYKPEYRLFVHYPFAVTGVYSLSTPTELTNLSGKVTKFNFECQGYNAQPDSYYVALFSGYPGEIIEYQDMESHLITSATYKNQTGEFASGVLYVPDDYAEKVKIGASSLFLSFARGGSTMFLVGNPSAIGYETVLDNEPSIRNINYTLNGSGEEGYMPNSAVPGEIIPLMFGNATATVEGANTASYTYASWPEKGYEVADSDINVTVTYPKYTLTLQTDGHGTLTANTLTGYPGDTITLTPTYNTYYRFNNYSNTGGSIAGNVFTFGYSDATAQANFKVNAFTATGGFEKGSNVACTAAGKGKSNAVNVAEKYAIRNASTGDIPASWYSTSNRWHPSNASAYSITLNTKMYFTSTGTEGSNSNRNGCTVVSLVGSTQNQSQSFAGKPGTKYTYNKSFTSNVQNYYGVSARMTATGWNAGYGGMQPRTSTITYIATGTNGTWTATGYAP